MADSVGVQIAKAVEARIKLSSVTLPSGAKTPPAGLTIFRERVSVIMPEDVKAGPLINISIGSEVEVNRETHKSPMTVRTLELLVGVYASANVLAGADATDPAYNWLIQALQSEPTMGGLSHWVSEEGYEAAYTAWEGSKDVVAAREVKVRLQFHSRTDDPEVRSN